MEVLKPDLEKIDGICYRINPCHVYIPSSVDNLIYNEDDTECTFNTPLQYLDEDESDFLNDIEEIDGGRFKASLHVVNTFFPYIIGNKGATKKRIETETMTKIIVPKYGQKGDIIITGAAKYNVARSRKRIKGIVFVQKNRSPFTHFISIPFTDPTIQQGFLNFKRRVIEICNEGGGTGNINESLFQSESKLHLTICTLVLCDDVDRTEASNVLEECKDNVIRPLLSDKNIILDMTGVEIMNDDPSEVDVLYGKVSCPEDPNLLQQITDGIMNTFIQKGIVNHQYDHVKLHVTLMNTLFRIRSEVDKKRKIRETFDATLVMKKFANYHFGQTKLDRIDLSLRYSSDKNSYYQATSSITIP